METREATKREAAIWNRYKTQFDAKTKPMVEALVLLKNFAKFLELGISEISGQTITVVDESQSAVIQDLHSRVLILDSQISGVLVKKYFIKIDDAGEIGIFADSAPEGDIFPPFVTNSISGFGAIPILVGVGIAAVTLLAGGFIALKIIETRATDESQRLMSRMQEVDRDMMQQPKEIRDNWTKLRNSAIKQAKAAAEKIPGVRGLLDRLLGGSGAKIALFGALGIAALYLLIPKLRRN